ncbi:Spx/MgsR family RNA polymerase-binding regulatory protein [Azohydromonas sp. G-1-1-14]|uniref:Spx/MgsR family RNA polymerase-binding regulatory protein n=1 Tax=Azohydromonas caseinilytica TaxID=2728836 RepID=A0A848F9L4_9BURK|nr:Spx/MgsR family RNA polymerase-binding regulatory protein [Azohydromonas caseinilytica]NML14701.1 Spx/MgsR family RNA polymerase-binding regulatory protein [Azohydromonas caseinilytica]
MRLYGIPNCDTVKRARAWLSGQAQAHEFVDFKKQVPDAALLRRWSEALGGVEGLVNRRGTTWRRLDEAQRAGAEQPEGALALLQSQPSLIRRPVVEWPDGAVTAGFDEAGWRERLPG